jgi:hypothetical protein
LCLEVLNAHFWGRKRLAGVNLAPSERIVVPPGSEVMQKKSEQALAEGRLNGLISKLPPRMAAFIRWVRDPQRLWLRVPVGVLLFCGGFLGMLPILGFWMTPLGLILLAQDFGPSRRALYRLINWTAARRPKWFGESYS